VCLSMTVQNVGYKKLLADPRIRAAFEAQVRGAVAVEAGHGIPPDKVQLSLRQGSVIVKATIDDLSPDTAVVVQSQLKSSQGLGLRVAESVSAVQGIGEISTGHIIVANISASSPVLTDEQLSGDKGAGFVLTPLSVGLVAVGSTALVSALLCLVCSCGRKRKPSGGGYSLAPKDDLTPDLTPHLMDEDSPLQQEKDSNGHDMGPDIRETSVVHPEPEATLAPRATPEEAPEPLPSHQRAPAEASPPPAPLPPARQAAPLPDAEPAADSAEADAAYAAFIRLADDMGFPENEAGAALAEAGGNSERALQRLLAQP